MNKGIKKFGELNNKKDKIYLTMYEEPPLMPLTLQTFETVALDRLLVLKGIEDAQLRGISGKKLKTEILKLTKDRLEIENESDVERDQISHFILRYAYCDSDEHQKWFLDQESALFAYRYDRLKDKNEFLTKYKFRETDISDIRLNDLFNRYYQEDNGKIYVVEFENVPDLIRHKKVIIENGLAYVPEPYIVSLLKVKFKQIVLEGLKKAQKKVDVIYNDPRLSAFIKNLPKQYIGNDYSNSKTITNIKPENIHDLSKTSFPLCMNYLETKLHERHHLRHMGRMQYSLYLKGIGLSLEDALIYWQSEFSSVPAEKFQKEYAYNIRHNYGKEGKRQDYTPYSCMKIICGSVPGPEEFHGCPYKHKNESELKKLLYLRGLNQIQIDDIISSVKHNDYQIACRKEFQYTHEGADDSVVGNHPNAYFDACWKFYHKEKEEKTNTKSTTESK